MNAQILEDWAKKMNFEREVLQDEDASDKADNELCWAIFLAEQMQ